MKNWGNEDLYASPDEIKKRIPHKQHMWLGTLTPAISTILAKYICQQNDFNLTPEEKSKIDRFQYFLQGVEKGEDFVREMREGPNEYKMIALLTSAENSNVNAVAKDLYAMLNDVHARNILDVEKLTPYTERLSAFAKVVRRNPHTPCNGTFECTCGQACDDYF